MKRTRSKPTPRAEDRPDKRAARSADREDSERRIDEIVERHRKTLERLAQG